jgi:hypothetical protein
VQFCLQPDDSFVVRNTLGTPNDTADNSNVVQICPESTVPYPDGVLYLYNTTRAANSECEIVELKRVDLPCVPVPDNQEFRIRIFSGSNPDYLVGMVENGEQVLTGTPRYAEAEVFKSAPGRNGQITLVGADNKTLYYSDQDITGSGDGPIYFDELGLSSASHMLSERHFTDPFSKDAYTNSAMNPVQFCLQRDNTFVVRNLGNLKENSSDDANIVQMCFQADVAGGPYTIQLHTAAIARNSPYCTTIRLQLAPDLPVFPTGCPSSTIPIPTDQLFRVKSSNFGTWLLGPELDQPPAAALTSDREAASLFNVSESSSDRIVYGATAFQRFEAYYTGRYGRNSGSIDFGPVGQDIPPVLFCLQPNNTFALFSVGDDGLQTEVGQNSDYDFNADPTVAVTCPEVEDSPASRVFIDNGAYMANNPDGPCYPDTLVYEPVAAPPSYEPPVGCPSGTIRMPKGMNFTIRSSAQQTVSEKVWLRASIDIQGTVVTTSNTDEATRFSPADDGTGRIQTSKNGYSYYSAFTPYSNNENSGNIRMYPDGTATPAVTFCLQSDNSLAVYSAGEDGPEDETIPADPRFVLTCPNRDQEVYLDNGSYEVWPCVRDTLYYEALPPLTVPPQDA